MAAPWWAGSRGPRATEGGMQQSGGSVGGGVQRGAPQFLARLKEKVPWGGWGEGGPGPQEAHPAGYQCPGWGGASKDRDWFSGDSRIRGPGRRAEGLSLVCLDGVFPGSQF